MLSALRALFVPSPPAEVEATYIALVAAARNPFFYTTLKVPDTLDGRFDMIVLHLFLLQHRLRDETAHTDFALSLSEAFVRDLDRNLRELGVADTGVSHRIKKMGKAYHGRLQAYSAALVDRTALCAALARNLYGTVAEGDPSVLPPMASYVEAMNRLLSDTPIELLTRGEFRWPEPQSLCA